MKVSEDDIKEMEENHIISEFSRKKKQQFLVSGILIAVILLVALGRNKVAFLSEAYTWIFFGIVAAAFIFTLVSWRCPACKKYLGRGFSPKHCPKCGVKLQK